MRIGQTFSGNHSRRSGGTIERQNGSVF